MSVNIEALIELKATKAVADDLAERIREERGLEARVGGNGNRSYPVRNSRFNGRPTSDNEKVIQRTIVVTGTSPTLSSAEQAIAHLRGMLRRYSHEVQPTLAAYDVYKGDQNNRKV